MIAHDLASEDGNTVPVPQTGSLSLSEWLEQAERYTRDFFSIRLDLGKYFVIPSPEALPWRFSMPALDPGTVSTREAVGALEKLLRMDCLEVWGGVATRHYCGCEAAGGPSLGFIEDSSMPNLDTMNKRLVDLRASQEEYLDIRGYALVAGLYYFAKKELLDLNTETWFPDWLDVGRGALARVWGSDKKQIMFSWDQPGGRNKARGARRLARTVVRI